MSKNKSLPQLEGDTLSFWMAGSDKAISLAPKIGQQIFIYGEYLKRKFYLDCNFVRENGKYLKEKNRYLPIRFDSYEELLNKFESILDINIKSGNIFVDNSKSYKRSFCKNKDLYGIISYLYKLGYRLFHKKIFTLKSSCTKSTKRRVFTKDKNVRKYEFCVSPYSYERIIFIMSDILNMNYNKFDTEFGFFAQTFYYSFNMEDNSGTYRLYAEIIKNYHLYMRDLTDMASPQEIIRLGYTGYFLPRFFDLPKLSLESHKYRNLLLSGYDPTKRNLEISLDIQQSCSIEEFSEFIKNLMIYYFYLSNEHSKGDMNEQNYKIICAYLDSANPHNSTSKFEDRIDGLYLWDRMYRHISNKSASNEIEIFLKTIKKQQPNSALKRKYQHILKSTTDSIERGEILPIAK